MRNYRIEDEDKGIAVERPIAVDLPDTRAIAIDSDDEAHSEWLEDAIAAEASVDELVATAVSPPSCQDGAAAMAASRPDDASRLGDPLADRWGPAEAVGPAVPHSPDRRTC